MTKLVRVQLLKFQFVKEHYFFSKQKRKLKFIINEIKTLFTKKTFFSKQGQKYIKKSNEIMYCKKKRNFVHKELNQSFNFFKLRKNYYISLMFQ